MMMMFLGAWAMAGATDASTHTRNATDTTTARVTPRSCITSSPLASEQAKLGVVDRLRFAPIRAQPRRLGQRAEALPDLEDLRLVVLDVLVRPLGIPRADELRVVVHGDVGAPAGHVVRDLIAGLDHAAGRERQLIGRRWVAGAGSQALAVALERLLDRLGAGERLHGHAAGGQLAEPAIDCGLHVGAAAAQEEPHHVLDDLALERLEAARAEAR